MCAQLSLTQNYDTYMKTLAITSAEINERALKYLSVGVLWTQRPCLWLKWNAEQLARQRQWSGGGGGGWGL